MSTQALTGGIGTGIRNNFTGCVGWVFTVGGANITVTDLGRLKLSGNNQTHTVRIMDGASSTLASVTVDMSPGSVGDFNFTSITPLLLLASTTYYIFSSEINGGDDWYDISGWLVQPTLASEIAVRYPAYELVCGVDVNPGVTNEEYGYPNFLFDTGTPTSNQPIRLRQGGIPDLSGVRFQGRTW